MVLPRRSAILFIVFLGIVSLFGDLTYEGARSITGPFLGALGLTATTIGIVAALGELLGCRASRRSTPLPSANSHRYYTTVHREAAKDAKFSCRGQG